MAIRRLPLFPLSTVLFPDMTLPIRVFEPRYRQMLRDCLREDRRFGVVLIRDGSEAGDQDVQPYSVGTIALVQDIGSLRRGALPITVVGERRFRILELDRSLPYLTATVELLGDGDDDPLDEELVSSARSACKNYLSLLLASQGMWQTEMAPPMAPSKLAYFMGMLCQAANPRLLQAVLENESLAGRLQAGIALLAEHQGDLEPLIMRAGPGQKESLFSSN